MLVVAAIKLFATHATNLLHQHIDKRHCERTPDENMYTNK